MTATVKEHQYRTIDLWQHAQNVIARNRRRRREARATRQNRGQRKRHNRRGHAWHNGHPSAMSSRSW